MPIRHRLRSLASRLVHWLWSSEQQAASSKWGSEQQAASSKPSSRDYEDLGDVEFDEQTAAEVEAKVAEAEVYLSSRRNPDAFGPGLPGPARDQRTPADRQTPAAPLGLEPEPKTPSTTSELSRPPGWPLKNRPSETR